MAGRSEDLNSLFVKFIESHKTVVMLNNTLQSMAGMAAERQRPYLETLCKELAKQDRISRRLVVLSENLQKKQDEDASRKWQQQQQQQSYSVHQYGVQR